MKEQDEHIEKQLQMFMQQNHEKAPEGFSDRIMHELSRQQQQPLPAYLYEPLLSKRAVAFIIAVITALGWLSTYAISGQYKKEAESWLQWYQLPEFSLPISINGTLLTIVVAAIFFLIALDRFLSRRMGSR